MSRASAGGKSAATWSGRAAFVVEAAATAALAVLLAQLVWVAYPPFVETASRFGGVAPVPTPSFAGSSLNPFTRGEIGASALTDAPIVAPATTLNVVLVGMRSEAGIAESAGSAIIQTPDNQQKLFRVGDEIVPGVTLASVESDRVIIVRDGQPESIAFNARPSMIGSGGGAPASFEDQAAAAAGVTAMPAEPVAVATAEPVDAQALMADITPFERAAGGVVIAPRGDGVAFAAAGFEAFDVLLSVNGVSIADPDAWASAFAGVGPGSTIVVEAQRAGAPVVIQFVLE